MRSTLILAALAACGGGGDEASTQEPTETGTDTRTIGQGACGDVSQIDATITGLVAYEEAPVGAATVRLEERLWEQKVYTTEIAGADGRVTLAGTGLWSVEDCWGSAIDYWVVADGLAPDGVTAVHGEKPVNQYIFNLVFGYGDGDFGDLDTTPVTTAATY